MATTQTITTIVESVQGGYIQVRHETIFTDETGKEIGRRFHRSTYRPGDDVSSEDIRVQNLAAAVWTPRVIQAYREEIAKSHLIT